MKAPNFGAEKFFLTFNDSHLFFYFQLNQFLKMVKQKIKNKKLKKLSKILLNHSKDLPRCQKQKHKKL